MKPSYLTTKIFLDSGNPLETKQALTDLGFLDGQTTNPSLVAKNPRIVELKNAGSLSEDSIWSQYKLVAEEIRNIIPHGSISVEVFSDLETPHEEMINRGKDLAGWFPGIFVKLPTTHEGLVAARALSSEGINVNMTLCFSQEQAAAVHSATVGAAGQVYVSPFIGRLDDIGFHGIDLIKNILLMYRNWNSHVQVLGASIRSLDHLFGCINAGCDIITIPMSIVELWKAQGLNNDPAQHEFAISDNKPIPYRDISEGDWVLYDIHHELTNKGIEKFVADWKGLFAK
ncbi:MAG: transaldolase family protein [Patescibacteria group bacterium]|nr:transaldolase family protein [Patescibacteria group bacterium]